MVKVLFICKTRISYGNSYGLLNSASFVAEYLNSIGISSKVVNAIDGNDIDRLITYNNPQFVIIEALWITPEKMKEVLSLHRHRHRLFIVRLHSRLTFLANEGVAFKWLLGYRNLNLRNLYIAPNNEEFANDLDNVFGSKSIYLPNIYNPPKEFIPDRDDFDKHLIKIGCFGSIRPMKNHLAQAMAAVRFAKKNRKKLEFHINATRMEQQGDQALQNLIYFFEGLDENYTLVQHDWLSYSQFVGLVKQMDIGMQVSLTETFNIVAADFVYNKVPFVGSKQILWLPERFQVEDPNSTDQMVKSLDYVWGFFGGMFRGSAIRSLNRYNKEAKRVWQLLF